MFCGTSFKVRLLSNWHLELASENVTLPLSSAVAGRVSLGLTGGEEEAKNRIGYFGDGEARERMKRAVRSGAQQGGTAATVSVH